MSRTFAIAGGLMAATLLAGCATIEEGAAEAVAETHRATLTGQDIVGGNGDADGYARAELTVSDELNQVCYDVNDMRGLGTITAVMIHRGGAGTNGPMVLNLRQANEGGWKNCVARAEWTEDALENNPSNYYFQIHTADYPNGAVRGQLMRDG